MNDIYLFYYRATIKPNIILGNVSSYQYKKKKIQKYKK